MSRVRVTKRIFDNGEEEFYPNLRIDTRTDIYWWDEMIDGHHHRKSTGEKSIKKALARIKRFRQTSNSNVSARRVRFSDALDLALDLKREKSKATLSEARSGDRRLREFFDDRSNSAFYLDQFDKNYEAIWNKYKKFAYERNVRVLGRRGSLYHDRKHLLYVLTRAHNNSWLRRKYTASHLQLEKFEVNSGRALDDEEVNALLKSALHDFKNVRLFVQIQLGVITGMRKGEILGLRIDELDWKRGVINISSDRIKTRTSRKLPPFIPADSRENLKLFCVEAKANKGIYLFPATLKNKELDYNAHQASLAKDWRSVRTATGVDCQFKDLRATCITNMVKERIPESTIANYVGNSVDMIRKIYDKVHQELREELEVIFTGKFVTGEGDE